MVVEEYPQTREINKRESYYYKLFGENFQIAEEKFLACSSDFEQRTNKRDCKRCKVMKKCYRTWESTICNNEFGDIPIKQVERAISKLESLKEKRI